MIEAILLAIIGLPLAFLCFVVVGLSVFLFLDALSVYAGSKRVDNLMKRRWK